MKRAVSLFQHKVIQAALVYSALLLVFLSTPILNIGTHLYSSADITQVRALLASAEPAYRIKNPLLHDPVTEMQPWLLFSREQIRQGRLPLWNPYNGNGAPLLANYQAAVFSPYSALVYVLPFRVALIAIAFLKLFLSGMFTYLFLRTITLRHMAALMGGVAFMFSSYNILWLGWNHAGVVFVIPASAYFVEGIFRRVEAGRAVLDRGVVWRLGGLWLTLLAAIIIGHAATLYYGAILLVGYCLFRFFDMWTAGRAARRVTYKVIRLGAALALTVGLAVGAAAIHLLPFAEYAAHSALTVNRVNYSRDAFPSRLIPLWVYPNLLGNPADPNTLDLLHIYFNYNELGSMYVGGTTLLLAMMGALTIAYSHHRKIIAFFVVAAGVWLVFAYNVFGLKPLFDLIPQMSTQVVSRSSPMWNFALACLAALGVDQALRCGLPRVDRRINAWLSVLAGFTLMAVAVVSGAWLASQVAREIFPGQFSAEVIARHGEAVTSHMVWMTTGVGAGIVLFALMWVAPSRRMRSTLVAALIGVVFWQTGVLFKEYNPTTEARFFFRETPQLARFRAVVGDRSVLFMDGEILIPPEMNILFKIPILHTYDAVAVNSYDRLMKALFDASPPEYYPKRFTINGLKLFGIQVVAMWDPGRHAQSLNQPSYAPVAPGQTMGTLFDFPEGRGKFFVVGNAIVASTEDEAFALVTQPDFDPYNAVVIQEPLESPITGGDASGTVNVETEEPTRVVIRVQERTQPGYLVMIKTYYPGWKAKINGSAVPVYRANYGFSAVQIPAGASTIEFYYDPDSVKDGALISAVSLLAGSVLFVRLYQRPRFSVLSRTA